MTVKNSTTRFSNRVADYVKYRPHYPVEIIDLLADRCGLTPDSVIADIGSGTGILSKIFLENGNPVIGVEPNAEMRAGGEEFLAEFARFTSVDGTAEATKLPPQSMDFALAGQAFHWFDQARARAEFLRILKPEGYAVLVWNDRRVGGTPFLADYEKLLAEHANDYAEVNHKNLQERVLFSRFYGGEFAEAHFDTFQRFDLQGMLGRLSSSSYTPTADQPGFLPMMARAREIFAAHQSGGVITFEYDTRVYYGSMR